MSHCVVLDPLLSGVISRQSKFRDHRAGTPNSWSTINFDLGWMELSKVGWKMDSTKSIFSNVNPTSLKASNHPQRFQMCDD